MATDYLMWVGYGGYPTIEAFVREAETRGACKRLSRVPLGFTPGESRVFLAHDEGIRGRGVIFGWFVPSRVEVIVDGDGKVPETVRGRLGSVEPTPVHLDDAYSELPRGCGHRENVMAIYATGDDTLEEDLELWGDEIELRGSFRLLKEPREYPGPRFRSIKQISPTTVIHEMARVKRPQEQVPPATEERFDKAGGTVWSEAELETLRGLLETSRTKAEACREFARISGRSATAANYQYRKMKS